MVTALIMMTLIMMTLMIEYKKITKKERIDYVFKRKKSDVQVGRVNTFHILQTIRKEPLNFRFCMKRSLRFPSF
jgi:hypothetical protein